MRYIYYTLFLLFLPAFSQAQFNPYYRTDYQLDSLHTVFGETDNDTLKMTVCWELSNHYFERDRDTTLYFSNIQLQLAKKLGQTLWQMAALNTISYELQRIGNYPEALKAALEGLKLAENESSEKNPYRVDLLDGFGGMDSHKQRISITAFLYQKLGQLHNLTGNSERAIENYLEAISLSESVNDRNGLYLHYLNLAVAYSNTHKLDSVIIAARKSIAHSKATGGGYWEGFNYAIIAQIFLQQHNFDSAWHYIQRTIKVSRTQQNSYSEAYGNIVLVQYFEATHQPDSVIIYANQALKLSRPIQEQQYIAETYEALSGAYQYNNQTDSAFIYLQLAKTLGDSLAQVEIEQTNRYLNLNFDEQRRQRELEEEKASFQTKIRTNTLLGSTFTLLIIAFFLYRTSRQKQKANILLKEQKEEIESTLDQLKSTQSQLIQSEKMASLGELTAGIAHEIQNPLNFVNNFSEVNDELIEELREAVANNDKKEIDLILDDLKENENKIKHHGQRAEGIVNGMLQHSRTSQGEKEPTNINALADEYLRLAYHGLRAKDKSFNADFKTDFDPDLPKINVIPQDIGRVLLNLINNAFFAVNQKATRHSAQKGSLPAGRQESKNYSPEVVVSTHQLNGKIEISVRDNGEGIPEQVRDKIFQPFFTTKPTGSGTGLGLSLSYDIVKAHGGELSVKSEENVGTEFTVILQI